MKELELKYGCNPNQKPSRIFMEGDKELPITVLSGRPGYINFMDALNGWQLVKELKKATGLPAAASFKHVSPAGAAVGLPLDDVLKKIYWVDDMGELSPLASAYARARGADRMSSFGDFISLSDVCDSSTARIIKREVSDGVIAPGYEPEALEILKSKKNGNYNVIQIDPDYEPAAIERKQIFGVTFEQGHNNLEINKELLQDIVTEKRELTELDGKKYGCELLGQQYTDDAHMWGRIMNIDVSTYQDKDGKTLMYASPSNLSPASEEYKRLVSERVEKLKKANPGMDGAPVPVDLVTCSGSGLDPDISPAAAEYQVERIAKASGLPADDVRAIVEKCTNGRFLGLFGEETVNVLRVNLMLDGILK